MRTVAVLPVKRFTLAKQRLGAALPAADRRTLAEAMVGDVLEALSAVRALERIVVVTAEPAAVAAGRAAGATVVHDADEAGQSAAALAGIAEAVRGRAQRVLLVPGDCPSLVPEEVVGLLDDADAAGAGPHVAIVPDRHGTGTNALVLAPPDAVVPSFGPGSFARHAAQARAAGARMSVAQVPSLGLDVDTAADLQALRAALAARPAGARRTRAVLASGLVAAPAA
jgi:2-phospho-L-lactate guanylyltransferase